MKSGCYGSLSKRYNTTIFHRKVVLFILPRKYYQTQRILGKGNFGTVYLVRDIRDQKNYALKIVECDPQDIQQGLQVFENLRQLSCPFV